MVALWLLTSVFIRVLLHRRTTGFTGIHRLRARMGSVEWIGGVLFVVSLIVLCVGAIAKGSSREWTLRTVIAATVSTVWCGTHLCRPRGTGGLLANRG